MNLVLRFALGSLKPFIYLRFEEHDAFASLVKRYFPIACPAIYGYDGKYGDVPENFSTERPLSEEETGLLRQYFQGVSDADEQLGRLWEFAKDSEEPIVLVYFGDHLPGFSNGMDFFSLLDYPIDANGSLEERLALYQTPYLIWQNDAANALCDIKETAAAAELPENGIISETAGF